MIPTRTGRRAIAVLGLVACCLALATSGVAAGGQVASPTDGPAATAAGAGSGATAFDVGEAQLDDGATVEEDETAGDDEAPRNDDAFQNEATSEAADEAPPADERVEVGGGLAVWERAFLPLRADADAASTVVPAPRVFVDTPSAPQTDLDRDRVAVYDPGTVPLALSPATGADVSQFGGEEVQVVVAHAAPNRSAVPPGALPAGVDGDALRESVDATDAVAAVDGAALRAAIRDAESGDGVDRALLDDAVDRDRLVDAVDEERLADALDDADLPGSDDGRLVAVVDEDRIRAAVTGEPSDEAAARVAAVLLALAAADVEPTDAELTAAVEAVVDGEVEDVAALRTALDRARVAVDRPSIAPFVGPLANVLEPETIAELAAGESSAFGEQVDVAVERAQLADDGTLQYDLAADEPGQYAVLVATGEPFSVEDGELVPPGEAGTVIGAEAVAVHERASSVAAPDAVTAGETAAFDVETGFADRPVGHAVLLYHENTLLYSQTTLAIDEDAGTLPSPANVTLEHSIGSVNGVARAVGDVTLAGVGRLGGDAADGATAAGDRGNGGDGVDGSVAGTIDLRGLLATAYTESGVPVADRVALGDQVLDASATAVVDEPDATVDVETLANATPGTYRYVHVATDWRDAGSVETSTGTLELEAPGGTPSDGDENESGGERGDDAARSDDGAPLCPPTLGLTLPEPSLSVDGPSVGPTVQPMRADGVPAGVRVCRSLGHDDGGTGFAFTSLSFATTADVDVDATLRRSATRPSGVDPVPTDADGLSYLTVEHDDALAAAAEGVELTVRVDRERLAAADRTLEDVQFYRFDGESWSELDHDVAQRTDSRATLVVESPGLSTFAATYRDAGVSEGETPTAPGAEASVVRVTSASVQPDTAYAGDVVDVTATIQADPPTAQEHVATLAVGGDVVAEQRVQVDDDGTATASFEHAFEAPGTYTLAVDGEHAGTVTIQERAAVAGSADESGLGATLALALAALGLLAIGGGYLFWRVGRSDSPADPL